MTTKITIAGKLAKSVASLSAVASSDKYQPLYTLVSVEIEAGDLTAIATDKYSLAIAKYEIETDTPNAVFYLDPLAVKFINSLKFPKRGYVPPVTFEIDEDQLTISHDGISQTLAYKTYAYPAEAMKNLTNNWVAGETPLPFGIDPARFASFSKIIGSDGEKIGRWVMSFGQPTNGNKPAPLRLSTSEITILTQPSLTN